MRAFTWAPGAPASASALALAALRQGGGRLPYTLVIGPCLRPDRQTPWSGITVEVGLYGAPGALDPLDPMLRGLATETAPGQFARGFFLRDLQRVMRPLAGRLVYGCADGPGWRVAVPVRVIPDASTI